MDKYGKSIFEAKYCTSAEQTVRTQAWSSANSAHVCTSAWSFCMLAGYYYMVLQSFPFSVLLWMHKVHLDYERNWKRKIKREREMEEEWKVVETIWACVCVSVCVCVHTRIWAFYIITLPFVFCDVLGCVRVWVWVWVWRWTFMLLAAENPRNDVLLCLCVLEPKKCK